MKKAIFLSLILFCVLKLNAQNPYDAIGKKTPMLTLSHGKYPEYQPYDSIQRVGSVVMNIKRGTIVKLLDRDSLTVEPEVSSRWISPDPLSSEYANYSPYCYVGNNPIKRIDPDGQDWWDVVAGAAIGVATNIVPGSTGLRNMFVPTDAEDYNATLKAVDNTAAVAGAGAMILGADEMAAGGAVAVGGLAVSTTGAGAVVGLPAAAAGGAVALKGAIVTGAGAVLMGNAAANQKAGYNYGNSSSSSSSSNTGKGKNNLKPDSNAGGDHSTFKTDKDGKITNTATYKANSQNPTGFDEIKRVDVKGSSHAGVPTPHVHEPKKPVRPAKPEELPRQ